MKVAGIAIDANHAARCTVERRYRSCLHLLIKINQSNYQGTGKPGNLPSFNHDLLMNILWKSGTLALERIVIHSIQEGTFYAITHCQESERD